jgi:hypothetical protein
MDGPNSFAQRSMIHVSHATFMGPDLVLYLDLEY